MEQTEQYAELMQHADPAFREKILQYEKKAKYQQAVLMKEKANSVEALQAAVDLLETIPNDPDAERLIANDRCGNECWRIQKCSLAATLRNI